MPELAVYYTRTVKAALEGRIFAPLHRFAAVAVAANSVAGRASIGRTARTLDDLGGLILVGGMGFPDDGWHVNRTRYLVMNLDREQVDPSLHLWQRDRRTPVCRTQLARGVAGHRKHPHHRSNRRGTDSREQQKENHQCMDSP